MILQTREAFFLPFPSRFSIPSLPPSGGKNKEMGGKMGLLPFTCKQEREDM